MSQVSSAAARLPRAWRSTSVWHSPWACVVMIVLAYGLLQLLATLIIGMPLPRIHDEYAQLLASDTFAHGRLTNPPHPLYMFFDTEHVLQNPTYMSKYPPSTGLLLALGQVTTGQPIVGMWLASLAACIAVWWMLRAVLSDPWPLVGALLLAASGIMVIYANLFLGGSIGVIGAALVCGVALRAYGRLTAAHGVALGSGLATLAMSRPLEGLLFFLAMLIPTILIRPSDVGRPWGEWKRHLLFPAGAVLLLFGAWSCYYNWRMTDDPLMMPYMLHEKQYQVIPFFKGMSLRPAPQYSHPRLAAFYTQVMVEEVVDWANGWGEPLKAGWDRLRLLFHAMAGCYLALPVLLTGLAYKRHPLSAAMGLATLLVLVALLFGGTYYAPHYYGPAVPCVMLLLLRGCHRLAGAKGRWRAVAWLLVALALVGIPASFAYQTAIRRQVNAEVRLSRDAVIKRLQCLPGKHLVFVEDALTHTPHDEWVYNGADLTSPPILWARSFGPQANAILAGMYPGYDCWLAKVDEPSKHHLCRLHLDASGQLLPNE